MELNELQICITSVCKIGCKYCHLSKTGEHISKDTFDCAIRHARDNNFEYVRLTGGNVFEHKNLLDFLKIIKDNGLKSIVNISIFSVNDFSKIIEYTDYVLFSFHNVKQLDVFRDKLKEFKNIKKDLTLMGCVVFGSMWFSQLKTLAKRVDIFDNFFFLRDTTKVDNEYFKDLNKCIEMMSQLSDKITFANGFPLCQVSKKNLKLCAGTQFDNGNKKLYIKPSGEIKPSAYSSIVLGDINDDIDLRDVWNKNQREVDNVFSQIDLCQGCSVKSYCRGGILTLNEYKIDPLFEHVCYNKYPTRFQDILKRKLFKIKDKDRLKVLYHEHSSFFMRYPPSFYWKEINKSDLLKMFVLKNGKLNLYVHFPFCNVSCKFCNVKKFNVVRKQEHIKDVLKEIEEHRDLIENNEIGSIYFGGGSPQLMGVDGAKIIFEKLFSLFRNKPEEVNFELFPKNFDEELMKYLKKYVTRVSIGIQCFNEKNLQRLNRIVSKSEMIDFITKVKKLNFDELNFDVIYGLFMNEPDLFDEDFEEILSYGPTHITYQPLHFTRDLGYDETGSNISNMIELNTSGRGVLKKHGFKQNSAEDFSVGDKLKYQGVMLNQDNLLALGKNTFGVIDEVCYKNYEGKYFSHELTSQDKLFSKLFLASRFLKIDISEIDDKFGINYKAFFSDSLRYLLYMNFIEIKNNVLYISEEGKDYVDLISSILSLSNLDYKLKN